MGKSRKNSKSRSIYDEIRKPVPKPGFAFKAKKKNFDRFDDDDYDIPDFKIRRNKNYGN